MNDVVIKVENLSKLYRLGELHKQSNSFREKVTRSFSRTFRSIRGSLNPFKHSTPSTSSPSSTFSTSEAPDHIYAIRNVSFEVKRGEIVGIIGRNGAGKTTLLKILSRITKPTEGKAWINGRVGSLLEVGTGFHPELTGRENIYLNGAILGMTKAEIRQKFDEIVDFADVEKFIDTPVKRYSSGMYVRLAFAVAAHLEPDILLVDEVLAVGDTAFQKKCLGKMEDVSKEGRTVLFVSHNMAAIKNLCKKAVVLDQGRLIYESEANKATREYLRQLSDEIKSLLSCDFVAKSKFVDIESIGVMNKQSSRTENFFWSDAIYIHVEWKVSKHPGTLRMSLFLFNQDDLLVFSTKQTFKELNLWRYLSIVEIPGRLLNADSYYLNLHLDRPYIETLIRIEPAARFTVQYERIEGEIYHERQTGIIKPELSWITSPKELNEE